MRIYGWLVEYHIVYDKPKSVGHAVFTSKEEAEEDKRVWDAKGHGYSATIDKLV